MRRTCEYNIQIMEFVKSMVMSGKEYFQSYNKSKAFIKINRNDVMLAARGFDGSNIDPKKAERTITELIYLFNQGEVFTEEEVIQLFFAITKLFRSPSAELRRMVYQMIKELRAQSSIYIVTQCLVKDIQDNNDYFKINALRTIHLVLDSSNLPQVERYIKTLIVDKNFGVSCAALLCGIQLFGGHEEMVRKWMGEVAEKLSPKEPKTQLHALILSHNIKRKDSMGFKKTLTNMMGENLPEMAAVQLIRFLKEHVEDIETASAESTVITNFLLRQARRLEPAVAMQAAKLACQSSLMSNKDLLDIIKILDSHLISTNTVRRYSVLKLYNKLLKNPSRRSLMMNISEIQRVLSDKNKSLSALAASILLRMCTQNQLQKLFSQISQSMNEMSDDFKIDVLSSIKNVIVQYPNRYKMVNEFLIKFMSSEKKYEFVKTIIQVMEYEIKKIGGEAKEECLKIIAQLLMKLDEERIHFQILGIISREVNEKDIESEFLKHLIAQIYLQNGAVRACSLSTLQKLSNYPSNKQSLLKRVVAEFHNDQDEEVRYRSIPKKSAEPYNQYQLDVLENYLISNLNDIQASANPEMLDWQKIIQWGQNKGAGIVMKAQVTQKEFQKKVEEEIEGEEESRLSSIIASHSTFSKYGKLLKVCRPVTLTENDSQFQVKLRKLFFKDNLILEYSVTNKIPNTILQQARVQLKYDTERLKLIHMIPGKDIKQNDTSDIFLGLQILSPATQDEDQDESQFYVTATLSSTLKYKLKEMKGEKVVSSYEDEYPLEDNELTFSDFMSPLNLSKGTFQDNWDKFNVKEEAIGFGLPYPNTQAAIKELTKHFGMAVEEGNSQQGSGQKANAQICYLSGMYLKRDKILMQCIVGFSTQSGCMLQLKTKCQDSQLALGVMNSIS